MAASRAIAASPPDIRRASWLAARSGARPSMSATASLITTVFVPRGTPPILMLGARPPGPRRLSGLAPPGARYPSSCGYTEEPIYYEYGSNVVYQDDQVYYGAEPVATAEEYAQQATQIAAMGQDAKVTDKEEWISLGVFGMVQGEEKDANNIFQLALNKAGIIRGNYYNAISDTTTPVCGSVCQQTQRAAWTVGD